MQHNQEFKVNPSKRYISILSLVLLTSALILISLPVAWWIRILLLALFLPYGAWIMWRFALLRGQDSILALKREADGRWLLETPQGKQIGELCGDSTVTRFVSVLRFKVSGQLWTQTAIIFRDSMDAEQYQQLIVVLRMY